MTIPRLLRMSGNLFCRKSIMVLVLMPFMALAQEPVFSIPHGIYDRDFVLEVSTTEPGGHIYYTVDGSDPRQSGMPLDEPLGISSTTVLRAATLHHDSIWSTVTSATYIFPQSVLTQTDTPEGYPAQWGRYCQISGTARADYGMDAEMTQDAALQPRIVEGLYSLPVISLVTDRDNFFSHTKDERTGGIYIYTGCPVGDGTGRGWERPVSFELFGGPTAEDLTVDCCIKLHGGHGRLPEKNPKHAFRLHFKGDYGPSKLRYPVFGDDGPGVHNALVLRTFFGYSWQHWDNTQRSRAQYCRDMWARYVQASMGHPISLARYAHLFINGMYWGLYNMCERVSDDFCKEKFGGKASDWDVTEVDGGAGSYHAAIADYGDLTAWNRMADYIYSLPDNRAAYRHLIGQDSNGRPSREYPPLLDVDNFIDYMLINLYGGNTDWDHHNWYAYRNRTAADRGFRFICWDSENVLVSLSENLTNKNNRGCPTGFLNRLMKEPLFAHRFHAAAQRHLFHGGALTPEAALRVWDSLYNSISTALYDEAARWGDYRRDVHPYSTRGALYTVDGQYQTERKRLLTSYFPSRTGIFVRQLQSRGWFPEAKAPELYLDGAMLDYRTYRLSYGSVLRAEGDEVYYTLDGTDPVTWDNGPAGTLSGSARRAEPGGDMLEGADWYSMPDTLVVRAISRTAGEWSPIIGVSFAVERPTPDFAFSASAPVLRRGAGALLSLCIDNKSPILAWQADFCLPDGIDWAKDADGKSVYGLSMERTTATAHSLSYGRTAGGDVRLMCRPREDRPFEGNSGEVAYIGLQVPAGTSPGEYTVQFRNVRVTDSRGELHALGHATATLTVADALRGDLNGDGAVDTADIACMLGLILETRPSGADSRGDLNGDGVVDGADVVRLTKAVLGLVDLDAAE